MAKAQTCYYPNSTSSVDTPCHSDAAASACCHDTDTCLSNGLCLAQGGGELISRGSCTDQSWESPNCPQYCADGKYFLQTALTLNSSLSWVRLSLNLNAEAKLAVNVGGGAPIFLVGLIHNQWLFCCSPWNNDTCDTATKGSDSPFFLQAGQVVFNRTSGSTSTSIAESATVTETTTFTVHATATSTVTAAALTSPSSSPSISNTSLSCSNKEAAVGAGLGVSLGIALLVALGLLWTQRKHKQSLRTDAQTWEWRYNALTSKVATVNEAEPQQIHQLPAWTPGELDSRPRSFPSEMADKPR